MVIAADMGDGYCSRHGRWMQGPSWKGVSNAHLPLQPPTSGSLISFLDYSPSRPSGLPVPLSLPPSHQPLGIFLTNLTLLLPGSYEPKGLWD